MNTYDSLDMIVRRPDLETEIAFCPVITSVQCGTVEYVPSADTVWGANWNSEPSITLYGAVDELRASRNTGDYIYTSDSHTNTSTLRFSLAGTCSVSTIRVYIYANTIGTSINLSLMISNNNTDWTAAQTYTVTTSEAEHYKDYTSLAWTDPAYCYVKFNPASMTYNNIIIYSMEVVTNP